MVWIPFSKSNVVGLALPGTEIAEIMIVETIETETTVETVLRLMTLMCTPWVMCFPYKKNSFPSFALLGFCASLKI